MAYASAAHLLIGVAGLLLVAAVAYDVFVSAIVPRPVNVGRLSELLIALTWPLCRGLSARLMRNQRRRSALLSLYGPATVLAVLTMWMSFTIVGFGLLAFAVPGSFKPTPASFPEAVYIAATSILTVGYGDFVPSSAASRFGLLMGAGIGVGILAVTTTFLFSLLGSHQRREEFVVELHAVAGGPLTGVALLTSAGTYPDCTPAVAGVFGEARRWSVGVLETHLAYPILAYHRSTRHGHSWILTLEAVLDAASLVLSSASEGALLSAAGPAYRVCAGAAHGLAANFARYVDEYRLDTDTNLDRTVLLDALERLRKAGYPMRSDEDTMVLHFATLRAAYVGDLAAMARYWDAASEPEEVQPIAEAV